MTVATLRLKKREERRLRQGHLWIFSNEVDTGITPLQGFEAGDPVLVETADGKPFATAYVNPGTLICARIVSRDPGMWLDRSLIVHRLNIALSLREHLFDRPFYRLVFGESDGLPGLVIDRYGDVLVAQITTAGMERMKQDIVSALEKVLRPQAILWRNDSSARVLEGLEAYVAPALGEVPETVVLEEHGVRFEVPMLTGQKTGWFYDQRYNRNSLLPLIKDRTVLDIFSYIGAWGVGAAGHGAREVTCVDASASACDLVRGNAAMNGVESRVQALQGDAFDILKSMRAERRHFDVVVLDPPALIKRKKDIEQGLVAYQRLNQAAMQLLAKDGLLVSCSCSYHLSRETLRDVIRKTSKHVDRTAQILIEGGQAPDHPLHPAIPETAYLKAEFCRILPAF